MSDYDNEPGRPRPEVVNETVVVVDGRQAAGRAWGLVLAVGIVAVVFGILVLANIWGSVHLVAIFAGLFLLFAGILQFFVGGGGKTGRIIAGDHRHRRRRRAHRLARGVGQDRRRHRRPRLPHLGRRRWPSPPSPRAARGTASSSASAFILAVVGLVFIIWPGPTVTLLMILVGLAALLFGISAIVQALRPAAGAAGRAEAPWPPILKTGAVRRPT